MNKLFPELIKTGHIYVGMSPLYAVTLKDGQKKYFWTTKEQKTWVNANKTKVSSIAYFKGLGEASYQTLRETSVDPKTRHIIKVTEKDVDECQKHLQMWMNNDSVPRKEWIRENIDFEKEREE